MSLTRFIGNMCSIWWRQLVLLRRCGRESQAECHMQINGPGGPRAVMIILTSVHPVASQILWGH